MKKYIPNFLTSMNILSGCIASVMAFQGNYLWVAIWIIIAAVFDFFDGFSARLLKSFSPIGKDLDSLADMVSFGMAPAFMVFNYLSTSSVQFSIAQPFNNYIPYISFLMVIFSGLRLAKFNIDERQTTSFIGLPTPANALFWISLCYSLHYGKLSFNNTIAFYTVILLLIVFSLLLTSEIPMFSLKVKNYKIKGNELRYFLFLFMIIAVIIWGVFGIALGIIVYIILSIISAIYKTNASSAE